MLINVSLTFISILHDFTLYFHFQCSVHTIFNSYGMSVLDKDPFEPC